jgi:tetratricopeptide (TPR) repeat protein
VAGNQLRVAGRLRESAEAFRRALLATPGDAALLYDFSRLLRSQASALGQAKLLSRAGAALRLAVFKLNRSSDSDGGRSGRLLARMGETFLEFGNAPRAARAFRSALEINPRTFRAQLGLADVALRDGKLAHVIHHYNDAARIAPDESLKRFARKESEYYSRLNDDEDYLAGELQRITWLQGSQRVQRLAARASFASILVALIGPSIHPVAGGIGLAVATSSVTAWVGTLLLVKFLKPRRRFPQDL